MQNIKHYNPWVKSFTNLDKCNNPAKASTNPNCCKYLEDYRKTHKAIYVDPWVYLEQT